MKQVSRRIIVFTFYLLFAFILSAQNSEITWDKRADFKGEKLESAIAFSIGKYGYVCTGGSDGIQNKKDCWEYDPKENKWEKLLNFPGEPRMSAVAFTIGDRAYIGTGLAGVGDNISETKDFWQYNPHSDSWTQKAEFPGEARSGAIGFSIGDKGYIALGAKRGGFKLNYYKDVWEYNAEKNVWTKKLDFPDKGRIDASVFVIESSAYVLLGNESGITASQKSVWEYNSKNNLWIKKSDFAGQPRLGANAFSVNNKGYIFDGFNGLNTQYQDFWEYDPATNSWNQKQDALSGKRNNAFCFVIDNVAYTGAGRNDKLSSKNKNDFWRITIKEPENKKRIDYNAKLLYRNKNQNTPLTQQGVSLIGEEKVIQKATTNDKGEFSFKKIDVDGKYKVLLDKNDKLPPTATVELAKPNGEIIQKVEKNKNNQFEYELSKLNLIDEDDEPFFNLEDFIHGADKEIAITTKLYHPSGSPDLLPEGIKMLDKVIKILNKYPNLVLEISSHTDSKGDDASNMQLSEKRALAVVNYIISNSINIVSNGIDKKRVSGKGYGETKILNRCKNGIECNENEHKENRRTEFKFIKQ